jgi:2-hydroxymuconate-semialdehyde hydrolase
MTWFDRYVVADGCTTHYLEAGEGPPLVLLHGGEYGAAAEITWERCIPALAADHRVLALDFVGFGHSDKLRDFGGQRRLMIRQVAAVLRTLRIEWAYFAGTSLSGRLLLDLANHRPTAWPILAMAVTGTGLAPPAAQARETLEAFDGTLEGLRPSMDVLFHDPRWRDSEDYLRRRYEFCVIPGAWETAVAGNLRSRRPQARPPARDYGGIAVPTCLIRGAHDQLVPADTWHELAAQIPGARTVTIEGSGHYPQIERADEWVAAVIDFFAGAAVVPGTSESAGQEAVATKAMGVARENSARSGTEAAAEESGT